jgi:hypothetical protein
LYVSTVKERTGEGDLLGRALLEQQPVGLVEQEDGEGAVEEPAVDIGHEVAWIVTVSDVKKSRPGGKRASTPSRPSRGGKSGCGRQHAHIFLLALPTGLSSLSMTMHTSSMSRTCSSS